MEATRPCGLFFVTHLGASLLLHAGRSKKELDIHFLAMERLNENYASHEEPIRVPQFRGGCHLLLEFDDKLWQGEDYACSVGEKQM